MVELKLFQVDSFTGEPFRGNPAGVCILQSPVDERWMQQVAAEMNLSETAFLLKEGDGFNLRWFTPTVEVELCGHATLASAHILWAENYLGEDQTAKFHTKSGLLSAKKQGTWLELDFPVEANEPEIIPGEMLEALGTDIKYFGKNRLDYIAEVASEHIVRNLKPNFELLGKISSRGVIVTSLSDSPEFDFVSRFFGPGVGINEDPVTGSAHCCLGPYWMNRLDKREFTAYQASARGGIVKVKVGEERVYLSGQAVTVFKGNLMVKT